MEHQRKWVGRWSILQGSSHDFARGGSLELGRSGRGWLTFWSNLYGARSAPRSFLKISVSVKPIDFSAADDFSKYDTQLLICPDYFCKKGECAVLPFPPLRGREHTPSAPLATA